VRYLPIGDRKEAERKEDHHEGGKRLRDSERTDLLSKSVAQSWWGINTI
jgi:hypothetical protein